MKLGEQILSFFGVSFLFSISQSRLFGRDADPKLVHFQMLAVIVHEDGALAIGAALVHAPALRGRQDLALVGILHLPSDGHFQVVDGVESTRHKHTDGRWMLQRKKERKKEKEKKINQEAQGGGS
jgi:hypothetical protein